MLGQCQVALAEKLALNTGIGGHKSCCNVT